MSVIVKIAKSYDNKKLLFAEGIMEGSITYAQSGVNIDKANSIVQTIKKIAKSTNRTGVIGDIGSFGGLFSINTDRYKKPILVSATDGVGTKLKIAFMMKSHSTIGIDLVAMSVNDIAVLGASPMFFLDYISTGKLEENIIIDVIQGIADGCKQAKCALLGGETAEMPGFYKTDEYDLVGFAVGIVDNDNIIDGSNIAVGNSLIGIASNGLHSNGYSLVRHLCFEKLNLKIDQHIDDLGESIGQCLLRPTKIYSEALQLICRDAEIHGLAHITGGGIIDNVSRILPNACKAEIEKDSWQSPPIFSFLQQAGNIDEHEMMRTFNNGLGIVAVVPDSSVDDILTRLNAINEKAWVIGKIKARQGNEEKVRIS